MKTDDKTKIKISNATKDRVAACKAYIESRLNNTSFIHS